MPTATPFNALGRGNGFATCLDKIDITDRGDGSPYFRYKVLTLSQAMKLYWNFASISASATAPRDGGGTLVASLTSANILREPRLRVCDSSGISDVDTDNDIFSLTLVECRIPNVFRLYNGSTLNESNFLGYGIDYIAKVQVDYILTEFIDIFYTGLQDYDGGQTGVPFTTTNITVDGVPLFKLEALDSVSSVTGSITSTDSYTY